MVLQFGTKCSKLSEAQPAQRGQNEKESQTRKKVEKDSAAPTPPKVPAMFFFHRLQKSLSLFLPAFNKRHSLGPEMD